MWWLLPIGIGVGVKLIYDAASEDERKARKRWKRKCLEVENAIAQQQEILRNHLKRAQESYNFHHLVGLHHASVQAANSAYQLLNDASSSFNGMSKMLMQAKEQRSQLQAELEYAKLSQDRQAVHETIEQLKLIHQLRTQIFEDRKQVQQQQASLLAEVRRLNQQTAELKKSIRDHCGEYGREWYQRLETRKQIKQLFYSS